MVRLHILEATERKRKRKWKRKIVGVFHLLRE
jgi:hypothetical protein